MVRKTLGCVTIILLTGAIQIGGCSSVLPIIPIPLDLAFAGIDEYEVQAGVPTTLKADFSGDPFEIQARRGTIEIDPSAVTIMPATDGNGKIRLTNQQTSNVCTDACVGAGVDVGTCAEVCDQNELKITIWIGATAEIDADCGNGDQYILDVTLNNDGVPTSIIADPASLTQESLALLNDGNFSICVQVISPIDGTIIIDEVVLNVGL